MNYVAYFIWCLICLGLFIYGNYKLGANLRTGTLIIMVIASLLPVVNLVAALGYIVFVLSATGFFDKILIKGEKNDKR